MKRFIFAFIIIFLLAPSVNAATMPGDVLVIFKNPSENDVSTASLASDGEHTAYLASVASEMDAEVRLTYDELSESSNEIFALIHSDTKSEQELLKEILARPDVKGAQLNHIKKLYRTPNDKYYSIYPDSNGLLWGMKAIRANEVWDKTTGSDEVYVAVIDTGIDSSHPDLAANVAKEYSIAFVSDGNQIYYSDEERDYQDVADVGHGSHVSGIIGAVGNNSTGVVGVNWKTKIITVKVFYGRVTDETDDSLIMAGMQYVLSLAKQGVNIAAVNMSLGGWEAELPSYVSNSSNPFWSALKALSDAGVVICVAAGNASQSVGVPAPVDDPEPTEDDNGELTYEYRKGDYVYPGSYFNIDNMIVVAAASQDVNGKIIRSAEDPEGGWESDSNYSGEYVDVAAPGSHIVSTVPTNYEAAEYELAEPNVNNYASWPGTSMATPHVTGAVALLKAAYPDATGAQIKKAILQGANKNYCTNDKNEVSYEIPANHTKDNTSKYGFLDVKAAYDLLPEIIEEDAKNSGGSSGGCEVGFMSGAVLILLFGAMKFKSKL